MPRRNKKSEEATQRVEIVNSSGLRWQPIAKSLREIDEEKIREAKEDVDTLLVFSGLFSAVLSAFLVESYQRLLPDKQDEMIFLLRTIANQNYAVSPGFLNATSPALSDEAFEVPEWALRVNGLWFASLIVSLATASLGMLVKSWLREYLAQDTEAPRERLRARYYREPSMKQWRVFEIVSLLPLFLQIALGLFFAGICFFTAFVERRVGLASLPLVLAWAFFLLLTLLGPLLSPRCPFKVQALKKALRFGRKVIREVRRRFQQSKHKSVWSERAHRILFSVWTRLQKEFPRRSTLVQAYPTPSTVEVPRDEPSAVTARDVDPPTDEKDDPYDEEDDVITRDSHDVNVLIAADLVMADDNLIDAMGEVIKQRHSPDSLKETVHFVRRLIEHRGGSLSTAFRNLDPAGTTFLRTWIFSLLSYAPKLSFIRVTSGVRPSIKQPQTTSSGLALEGDVNNGSRSDAPLGHPPGQQQLELVHHPDVPLGSERPAVANTRNGEGSSTVVLQVVPSIRLRADTETGLEPGIYEAAVPSDGQTTDRELATKELVENDVFPDLHLLSKRAYLSLMDVLADSIAKPADNDEVAEALPGMHGRTWESMLRGVDREKISAPTLAPPQAVDAQGDTATPPPSPMVEPETEPRESGTSNPEDPPTIPRLGQPAPESISRALSAAAAGSRIEDENTPSTSPAVNPSSGEISIWHQQASLLLLGDSPHAQSVELDDRVIVTVCSALKAFLQSLDREPEMIIHSVIRVIERRSSVSDSSYMLDLGDISRAAYIALIEMTVKAMQQLKGSSDIKSRALMEDARKILLSNTKYQYDTKEIVSDDLIVQVCESLQYSRRRLDVEVVMSSVSRLIEHCLGKRLGELKTRTSIPDLSRLTPTAYGSLIQTITRTIQTDAVKTPSGTVWQTEAAILLVSIARKGYDYECIRNGLDYNTVITLCKAIQSANLHPKLSVAFTRNLLEHRFGQDMKDYNKFKVSFILPSEIGEDLHTILVSIISTALEKAERGDKVAKIRDQDWVFVSTLLLARTEVRSEKGRAKPIKNTITPIICQAIDGQRSYDPSTIIQFVLGIIERQTGVTYIERNQRLEAVGRAGTSPDDEDFDIGYDSRGFLPGRINLEPLKETEYSAIMNVIASTVLKYSNGCLKDSSLAWLKDATLLLLSSSVFDLPERAVQAVRRLLHNESEVPAWRWRSFRRRSRFRDTNNESEEPAWRALGRLIGSELKDGSVTFTPMFRQLVQIFDDKILEDAPPIETAMRIYYMIITTSMSQSEDLEYHGANLRSLSTILQRKSEMSDNQTIKPVLSDIWTLLRTALKKHILLSQSLTDGAELCFSFVISYGDILGKDEATDLFSTAWRSVTQSSLAWATQASCYTYLCNYSSTTDSEQIIIDAFMQAKPNNRRIMIENSRKIAKQGADGDFPYGHLRATKFCKVHLQIYEARSQDDSVLAEKTAKEKQGDPTTPKEPPSQTLSAGPTPNDWTQLWSQIVAALKSYLESHYPEKSKDDLGDPSDGDDTAKDYDVKLAGECLIIMARLNMVKGKQKATIFPKELFDVLLEFAPSGQKPVRQLTQQSAVSEDADGGEKGPPEENHPTDGDKEVSEEPESSNVRVITPGQQGSVQETYKVEVGGRDFASTDDLLESLGLLNGEIPGLAVESSEELAGLNNVSSGPLEGQISGQQGLEGEKRSDALSSSPQLETLADEYNVSGPSPVRQGMVDEAGISRPMEDDDTLTGIARDVGSEPDDVLVVREVEDYNTAPIVNVGVGGEEGSLVDQGLPDLGEWLQ